jgi:hypothetical protein
LRIYGINGETFFTPLMSMQQNSSDLNTVVLREEAFLIIKDIPIIPKMQSFHNTGIPVLELLIFYSLIFRDQQKRKSILMLE